MDKLIPHWTLLDGKTTSDVRGGQNVSLIENNTAFFNEALI